MPGVLTDCQAHREGHIRTLKETKHARGTHRLSSTQRVSSQDTEREKPSVPGALTSCQVHREGQVRTLKETECARGTHRLSSAQAGSSQDTERNWVHQRHSQTVEQTGRVESGH